MSIIAKKFELVLPNDGNAVSIALVGASRSGKTTMLKHLYKSTFQKHITVMCSMNKQADIYKDLSSKVIVSDRYDPSILSEMHKINAKSNNKFPFLFISDDYVDRKIKNCQEVTRAMTIYRNANVSSIWSFQGRVLLSSVGRMNINYIAVFRQNTPMEWSNIIKEVLDMYLPMGLTMTEKIQYCKEATENHQLFWINTIEGTCILTKLSPSQIL